MTKRVHELEKGNIFIYMGVECVVTGIGDGRIYYRSVSDSGTTSHRHSFGINCKAKVEMAKYIIRKPAIGSEKKKESARFKKGEMPKTYQIKTKGLPIRNGTQSDGSW